MSFERKTGCFQSTSLKDIQFQCASKNSTKTLWRLSTDSSGNKTQIISYNFQRYVLLLCEKNLKDLGEYLGYMDNILNGLI